MSRDVPIARHQPVDPGGGAASTAAIGTTGRRTPAATLAEDSRLAVEIRGLVERDEMDQARERFGELVAAHQRRASRIAFQYLRDVADDASTAGKRPVAVGRAPGADPERALLARERGATLAAAVDQLDGRQRTV